MVLDVELVILVGSVACDVTGGVVSLNFDATELKIFNLPHAIELHT